MEFEKEGEQPAAEEAVMPEEAATVDEVAEPAPEPVAVEAKPVVAAKPPEKV